jgi:hypothetical protein
MYLDTLADVRDGMARLADAYNIYIVSNGDPAMLDAMVQVADIGDYVVDSISADEVRTSRPPRCTSTPPSAPTPTSTGWPTPPRGGSTCRVRPGCRASG